MFSKFLSIGPNFAIVLAYSHYRRYHGDSFIACSIYPDVVPPQIIVSTSYPGADAKTLENSVASILEEKINGAGAMLYMMSTTSPGFNHEPLL